MPFVYFPWLHSSRTNNFSAPVNAVASIRKPAMATECRAQVERLRNTGINQIGLIPYGAGGGDREETLKEFVAAVS